MSQDNNKTYSILYGGCCATATAVLNYFILKFIPDDAKELTIIASYLSYGFGYLIYLGVLKFDTPGVSHMKKRLKRVGVSLNDPNISESERKFYQQEYDRINREILEQT